MKSLAKTIKTPVGTYAAPLHPGFEEKLAKCSSDQDLFGMVETNGFIDPDAFNEVRARGLYDEYKKWKQEAANE